MRACSSLLPIRSSPVTMTNGVSQILSFKKSPDFEMPGDWNDDNLYEVTVRASDGTMSADRMVVVKVTKRC